MSQLIVTCDRISKCYKLGATQQKSLWLGADHTLRDGVASALRTGMKLLKGSGREKQQDNHTFWALKDVSFEIGQGEVIGLVGSNGAGKSTLLKILSRVVEPTGGMARLRGRVASLLEVGTGFHPELSGRENIYMNGAILGMRKAEIDRRFDEIVAFSEIEKFLDTPAKRYSSGMYVRLAFAVAAHLEPEVLIVDEVLAVGDFAFQKKCLGKMHDVAASAGRTIVFVSHNMSALSQLCERGILLEKGLVTMIGPIKDVIQKYLKAGLDSSAPQARFPIDTRKRCQYISAEILHGDGTLGSEFSCDEPVTIRLRYEIRQPSDSLYLTLSLQNLDGTRVLFSNIHDVKSIHGQMDAGLHTFEITIPPRILAPTTYLLTVGSGIQFTGIIDQWDACCEFSLRELSTRTVDSDRSCVLGLLLPWDHQDHLANNTSVHRTN
jgi:lipopolysaccharide transport system ATP-binding protein